MERPLPIPAVRVHRIDAVGEGTKRPLRRRRLQRIADHPFGMTRLPHRCVELCLMSPQSGTETLAGVLRRVSPGHVIVVHSRGESTLETGPSLNLAFEPVPLNDAEYTLKELVHDAGADAPSGQLARTIERADALHTPDAESCNRLRSPAVWAKFLLFSALFLGLIFAFFTYLTFVAVPLVLIATGWALLVGAKRLTAHRNWWVVPGGLIYREHRLWRRECTGGLVTRVTSPLYVNRHPESRIGAVVDRGVVLTFPLSGETIPALVQAWRWKTEPPTEAEVSALLGLNSGVRVFKRPSERHLEG